MPVNPATNAVSEVRFLVGDTAEPYLLTDDQIQFALDQANAAPLPAATACARALAARFARDVNERFEDISSDSSDKSKAFERLARRLDADAKRRGGLGIPSVGGVRRSEMDAADADNDRVKPSFRRDMFGNPPESSLYSDE